MTHRDNKIRGSLTAAAAALFFGCLLAHPGLAQNVARSDGPISCGDFQRGSNGSWTVLRPTTMKSPRCPGEPDAGATFAKNQFVGGIEVTTVLDRNCGNR